MTYDWLTQELASEFSSSDLASRHGVSSGALRSAAARMGIKFNAPPTERHDYRAVIQDMKPLDAVEYLLGVLEQLNALWLHEEHPVDGWNLPLTASEARMLKALYDAAPRCLSKEQMYSVLYAGVADADDLPGIETLRVFICHIRRVLPADVGEIKTVYGLGYCLHLRGAKL